MANELNAFPALLHMTPSGTKSSLHMIVTSSSVRITENMPVPSLHPSTSEPGSS